MRCVVIAAWSSQKTSEYELISISWVWKIEKKPTRIDKKKAEKTIKTCLSYRNVVLSGYEFLNCNFLRSRIAQNTQSAQLEMASFACNLNSGHNFTVDYLIRKLKKKTLHRKKTHSVRFLDAVVNQYSLRRFMHTMWNAWLSSETSI